ncbi:trypsin-1-like isoform X2 [Periplaneta americana]|uniref:trypsin-1-like isoform X2 n=1 Tax=Periplaneta americana TaxID=6978 RepID=UPI0037E85B33
MFQRKIQLRGNLRCLQLLLFVVTVSGAHVETPDSRIVAGSETTIEEYPYQLSMQLQPKDKLIHNCGASIISEKWALSAAHCVEGLPLDWMSLRAGSTYASKGGSLHKVKKIYMNNYDPENYENDICLLEVEPPFEYSKSVQAIPMESSSVAGGTVGVATGWGRVEGDSGGPFVVNGKLLGVVSWGLGCARKGIPGVLSNVSYFRGWVKDVTDI